MNMNEELFIGRLKEGLKVEKGRDQGGPGKIANLGVLQAQVPAAQAKKMWSQLWDSRPAQSESSY